MYNGSSGKIVASKTAAAIGAKCFISPLILHTILYLICRDRFAQFTWSLYLVSQCSIAALCFAAFYAQHRRNEAHCSFITRSAALSFIFGAGWQTICIACHDSNWWKLSFGAYLVTLSAFHFTEFLVTATNQPNTVTSDAFLLNHSAEYHLALLVSVTEFALETWFLAEWKFGYPLLMFAGVGICVTGEFIRKLAMLTAGKNFNHIIVDTRRAEHSLVTDGIYAIWRHPSYVGWFYWSLGTQIILLNPISFGGYLVVSWRFFRQRIEYEEATLVHFFGAKYLDYKRRVPTGLPFIEGF